MATFSLTELQAHSILEMRLRSLRKLEEMEIRKEHKKLSAEQKKLQALVKSDEKQWAAIAEELEATRTKFGEATALGKRRTALGAALPDVVVDVLAFAEKEPITVILSEKGWIRAQKGHLPEDAELRFKEGDSLHAAIHAQTTDRIVLLATSGKCYTLKAEAIPRGRGDGQPLRLLVEMTNEDAVVAMFVHAEGAKWLLASSDGKGFVVKGEELLAEKRTGKQVLLVEPGKEACICTPVEGDTVAAVSPRNLLVFPLDQVPEMTRGRGVQLIALKDGELQDAKVFAAKEGLTWRYGSGVRVETDLRTWRGQRAGTGKAPPTGFPKNRKFGA
jgi:topoisomerase-4 subunit A